MASQVASGGNEETARALMTQLAAQRSTTQAFDKVDIQELLDLFPSQHDMEKLKVQTTDSANINKGGARADTKAPKKQSKPYLSYSKAITQMEAADERRIAKLRDHIVVCGIHTSIRHLILPLRAKYLKHYLQDIVIINPSDTVPKHIWDTISCFERIFIVYGSPLDRIVLKQAQIQHAAKAVILSDDPSLEKQEKDSKTMTNEMLDAKNIFIYKAIKKINPTLQIITELTYSSNIEFLQQRLKNIPSYLYQKMYTAGEVYISTIIDTLTAQACYNPHIVTILQQILVGRSTDNNVNPLEEFLDERFKDEFNQSNIWQIPVPEEMINRTYDKLFKFLLEKRLVALGLYRLPGASDNKYPFVSTNPAPHITISVRDRVFVLGNHISRELIVENNREVFTGT